MRLCKTGAFFLNLSVLFLTLCPQFQWISRPAAASTLSCPWIDTDIGSVGQAGSASATGGGVFSINGSGQDIYYGSDAFHYVYQPLTGDGSIVARVLSVQNTSNWAKSGVMIRESLTPDSAQADVVVTPGKGVVFQRRDNTGGGSFNTAGPLVTAAWWVKLTRSGDTFTAYQSPDGSSWTAIGSDSISMAANVFVGLAVTAHNNSALCSSTIDNVSVNTVSGPAPSETVLLAEDFSSSSIDTSKWVVGKLFSGLTDTSVAVSQGGQQLRIGPLMSSASGSHYNGIRSATTYDFTGAYVYVEVSRPPSSATLADAMFTVGSDGNNFYRMYIEGGNLFVQRKIRGAKSVLLVVAYDATNFKFLRIRHDAAAGTVSFETAPDVGGGVPGGWTPRYSEAWNTSWVPVGSIQFELKAGTWQSEASIPGSVIFDSFRAAAPPGAPPPIQPPTVSITANPSSGIAPLPVSFQSSAASPNGIIQSYSWTFGDGATSSQASPSHTYQTAGNYTARLVVTDQLNQTASASVSINAGSAGSVEVKVMQCNIQWGNGTDDVYNLDRQANYMVQNNPDILSLNEVPTYANQAQQFADLLTQKTGVAWSFYFTPISPGNNVGQCILTKWPILSTNSFYMDAVRSVAQATINVNGKTINFFSTHLDPDASSTRIMQVNELTSWAASFAEPRIVAGDFNSWPGGTEIATMTQSYFDSWVQAVNAGQAVAYPDNPVDPVNTRTRRARIDYIFYSRGAALSLSVAQVPDTRDLSQAPVELLGTLDDRGVRPSDHNWYTATFQLQ